MAIEERLRVMRWGDEVAICLGDELVFEIAPGADPDVAEKLARSFLPTLPVDEAPELDDAFFEKALLSQPGDSLIAIAEGSVEQLRQRGWKQEDFARALKRMLPTSEGVDESEPPEGYIVQWRDDEQKFMAIRFALPFWQCGSPDRAIVISSCWAAFRAQQPVEPAPVEDEDDLHAHSGYRTVPLG